MMKIIDQIYECQVPGQVFGLWTLQCRLRIFELHPEVQIVMITDMGIEMDWFIPYRVEVLAEQIVQEFKLELAKVIWIEHFTPTFRKPSGPDASFVTFTWCNGQATDPQRNALTSQLDLIQSVAFQQACNCLY